MEAVEMYEVLGFADDRFADLGVWSSSHLINLPVSQLIIADEAPRVKGKLTSQIGVSLELFNFSWRLRLSLRCPRGQGRGHVGFSTVRALGMGTWLHRMWVYAPFLISLIEIASTCIAC